MAEKKCPCLVVYDSKSGPRLTGSGSESDRYIIEAVTVACIKSAHEGTIAIGPNRCVTLPNGVAGIVNTDIPSMTDSEFMILFDDPLKFVSIDAKPQPLTGTNYTSISTITFDINQANNSLRFSVPDTSFYPLAADRPQYGYWHNEYVRQFNYAALGHSINTMTYSNFDPLGATTSFINPTIGQVHPISFMGNTGNQLGPDIIPRTGDLKVLVKFDVTIGTYNSTAGDALKFEIGTYDATNPGPVFSVENERFTPIIEVAWVTRRTIVNDATARERKRYHGQFILDTRVHNDSSYSTNFTQWAPESGFQLRRLLAIKPTVVIGSGTTTLVVNEIEMNYKWIY